MSFWSKMTDFFDKYGGRNGTKSEGLYDSNSYGTVNQTESGYGYGTYEYINKEKSYAKRKGGGHKRGTDAKSYDETGNSETQFRKYSYDHSKSTREKGSTASQFAKKDAQGGATHQTRERGRFAGINYDRASNDFRTGNRAIERSKKDKPGTQWQTPKYGNRVFNAKYDNGTTDYRGGSKPFEKEKRGHKSEFWQTPRYGNLVYNTDFDYDDQFASEKRGEKNRGKKTPLRKDDYVLDSADGGKSGLGRKQTTYKYPINQKAIDDWEKRKKEERAQVLKASQGYKFQNVDMNVILESNGITMNRMKNKILTVKRININRTPSPVEIVNYGKQYIFFSKPDLNLFSDNSGTVNPSIKQNCPDLYMKIMRNPLVAQQLQSSFGGPNRGSGGGIITQLSNMCNECNWPEMGLSKKEGAKNIKGQGISYGGDFYEAVDQNELSISFLDNRDRDIQTLFEIWTEYIEGVNNGTIIKKSLYINNNTVDYAINIWVLTLDESYNILSWGMAGACFPLSVSTDILNYSAVPKTATELSGPFQYKFHVSYFHKPNMHRTIEMLNYATGFKKLLSSHLPNNKASYQFTHHKVNGYWVHAGFIPYHTVLFYGYEYHFNIEDKFAEMVGVHISYPSSGDTQYSLVFASRDVGKPKKPGSFGTNEYNFYKFDDDIGEVVKGWQKWTKQHPDYYKNKSNVDIIAGDGVPLWNQEKFNPDYQAWLISRGGRTWNERFNRGYNSSSNRYGAFSSSGSNSGFFSGAASKIANAFRRRH